MAYKYDVFLSYRNDNDIVTNWVRKYFFRFLGLYLEDGIGRSPRIYIDKEAITVGDQWRVRLQEDLTYSKCMVPFLSPSYFESEWCKRELYTMLKRQKQLDNSNSNNNDKRCKLILPVLVSDGDFFPEPIKDIQRWDFKDYILDKFELTPIYIEFQKEVKRFSIEVAKCINQECEWREEWLNEVSIEIPENPDPPFHQPVLSGRKKRG